ncbi:TPA: helix-turn-helix transcriptional regulator [Yersinia enterocolitica]|nr:helix-turn-helix transcriptional regulator [Yersinia enterocolitica]
MKMELSERLKKARKAAKLTQVQLGERAGVTQAAIQKIEAGKVEKTGYLVALANALNVDPQWLSGEATNPDSNSKPYKSDSSIPPESEWGSVDAWDSDTPLPDDEVYIRFYKDIELAAGHGKENGDDHNAFLLRFSKATLRRYGAQKENVVSFPIHGNSMLPVMPEKTTVTVDTGNKKIVDGGIYAICQDGLCRLKILYRLPGNKLSIRSYNKDEFPDEEADLQSVEIIGRVINWSVMAW